MSTQGQLKNTSKVWFITFSFSQIHFCCLQGRNWEVARGGRRVEGLQEKLGCQKMSIVTANLLQMIFESLFHFMYSWTITSIMPTFILETSCEGHLYMDTNCNQLQHRKILHWELCGAFFLRKHILGWHRQGKPGKLLVQGSKEGNEKDCFIPDRISFIHSFIHIIW